MRTAKRLVWALLLALVGCRARDTKSSLAAADLPPPNAVFKQLCAGQASLTGDSRGLFFKFVGEAFTTQVFEFGNQGTSSADPKEVFANHDCDEIWAKFVEWKAFSVLSIYKDVRAISALQGIPDLKIKFTLASMPIGFENLNVLDMESLEVTASDFQPLVITDSDREKILDTLATLPTVRRLTVKKLLLKNMGKLSALRKVEELVMDENGVSDLSFLAGWNNLRSLSAFSNPIHDLTPLKDLITLEHLEVSSGNIESIEPLMFLANLSFLAISHNLPPLTDILAIQYLPNLRELQLGKSAIKNIDPIKGLPLASLDLSGNAIDSIEPLAGMPLKELFIGGTKVKDLKPITTMPNLTKLNCDDTPLKELPEMPATMKLKIFSLANTQVQNYCNAKKLPSMVMLRYTNGQMWTKSDGAAGCH